MKRATASAPSKVILFGEHAVVYGKGALVTALDRRTTVDAADAENITIHAPLTPSRMRFTLEDGTLVPARKADQYRYVAKALEKVLEVHGNSAGMTLRIRSGVPIGAGLGSSASAVVATIASSQALLGLNLDVESIQKMAHETEREVQGASSGVDVTVATHGGLLFYRNGTFENLPTPKLPLAIGYTRQEGSTRELVAGVRRLHERHPGITKYLFEAADAIASEARHNLSGIPDLFRLGELMDMNQGILQSLGVSTPKLEKLIGACRKTGAYGAKLTGAGGGGCMIALGRNLEDAIRKAGGIPIKARVTEKGVRVRVR